MVNLLYFELIWNHFCYLYDMNIPIIVAAGGLVWNENNELLMIFRQEKWDLPKGKLDDGESIETCAIREVREETGLTEVILGEFIGITHHEYFDRFINAQAIKESHWYNMRSNSHQLLNPQLEENITDIKWVSMKELATFLENSYLNIETIIKQYFSLFSEPKLK